MIEIFSTNIKNIREANIISGLLHLCFPNLKAHVDLYDIEHILRVESDQESINVPELKKYVKSLGFSIELVN